MDIHQNQIAAILAPLAKQGSRAAERTHIYDGRFLFGAGYISRLTEDAVEKYTDGDNNTVRIPFSCIDRIVITDAWGKALRSYDVVRDEPETFSAVRVTYGMGAAA